MEEKEKKERQKIALVKRLIKQLNYYPNKMQARQIINQIAFILRDFTQVDEVIFNPIERTNKYK